MKTCLPTLTAGLLLAGCAGGPAIDTDRSNAIRMVFQQQIAAWNAAGIDPVQLPPQMLLYASLACGTLSSLSTLVDPTAPTLPAELGAWCTSAVAAAAPAVPNVSPVAAAVPEADD